MNNVYGGRFVGLAHKLLLCLISVTLLSCDTESREMVIGAGEPEEVVDYHRVVSLAPSITEILFALEQGDKVVGIIEAKSHSLN